MRFIRKGQRVKVTKPLPRHKGLQGKVLRVTKGGGTNVYDIIVRLPSGGTERIEKSEVTVVKA